MTAEELNKLVDNDPGVKTAGSALQGAKNALNEAIYARDIAYGYYTEKQSEYDNTSKFLGGLKEQRRLLTASALNDYNTKATQAEQKLGEYRAALGTYNSVRKAANDRIVLQAQTIQASEIEKQKADAEKAKAAGEASKVTQISNVNQTLKTQQETVLTKLKANKVYIIGALVVIIVVIIGVVIFKQMKK